MEELAFRKGSTGEGKRYYKREDWEKAFEMILLGRGEEKKDRRKTGAELLPFFS